MTPEVFLSAELESVRRALKEILRHEYGPEGSAEFYREFTHRIQGLEGELASATGHAGAIQIVSGRIRDAAARISLIERSHLGEFSWPFANTLQKIGSSFDDGRDMDGHIIPLVHVISEGADYKIIHDTSSGVRRRPIPVVAFPRQLKHHVLLHALFGHEMGHLAIRVTGTHERIKNEVWPHLRAGALQDEHVLQRWLDGSSLKEIKDQLEGRSFKWSAEILQGWILELTSDLFGLVLFGPAFVAAHRTLLAPQHASPYRLNLAGPTHPPYAIRRSILARAMHLLTWSHAQMSSANDKEREAEATFLAFLTQDPFPEQLWTKNIIEDADLLEAVNGIRAICADYTFVPLEPEQISRLLNRLSRSLPPTLEDITPEEKVNIISLTDPQILFAGWMYWLGRRQLESERDLTFEEVNRLCDMSLLHHGAIRLSAGLRQ